MVVDTEYYDLLGVEVTATDVEIKKAYRKKSVLEHPDKNREDPSATERFQAISQAYQVLGDKDLRANYDKSGKEKAIPKGGFEDAAEQFSVIFGGEAFSPYIGELTLLKNLQKQEELHAEDEKEKKEEEEKKKKEEEEKKKKQKLEKKKKLEDKAEGLNEDMGHLTVYDEKNQAKETAKKSKLEEFEEELNAEKEKNNGNLVKLLIERLSILTESAYDDDCKYSFQRKFEEEANLLKMESFGLDILHTIGNVYCERAKIYLASNKVFGLGGMFQSMKARGGVFMDTLRTVSAAIDAQSTMKELETMKEASESDAPCLDKQGNTLSKPTPEELAHQEEILMGKVLSAAWYGSKYEIMSTLRTVCDRVLEDESYVKVTRDRRAEALILLGKVFQRAYRTTSEQEEAQIFEQLVAEATKKKRHT